VRIRAEHEADPLFAAPEHALPTGRRLNLPAREERLLAAAAGEEPAADAHGLDAAELPGELDLRGLRGTGELQHGPVIAVQPLRAAAQAQRRLLLLERQEERRVGGRGWLRLARRSGRRHEGEDEQRQEAGLGSFPGHC
jgi:hypothetical protein